MNLSKLYQQIIACFNRSELQNLCLFGLGIPYESLPGDGLADKTRELIAYCLRHGRFPVLLEYCQQHRPHADWSGILDVEDTPSGELLDKAWNKLQALCGDLKMVQAGWIDGSFVEDQVVITFDNPFELPSDIASKIRDSHIAKWEADNMTNNVQFGIFRFGISEIDPHRVLEDRNDENPFTHKLRIRGHEYHYFDFLSTHMIVSRERLSGTEEEEKIFLKQKIGEQHHYLEPVSSFPNPLSVGLSLFCENGDCLVLTHRTKLASSGGHLRPNKIFNAVGENVNLTDEYGEFQKSMRLSPWITAKRGLEEEVGIEFNAGRMSLQLHSFAWDARILDYKFFGYVVSKLSQGSVEYYWTNAPDRHENKDLIFRDTSNSRQCAQIIREITQQPDAWAPEAKFSTIRSLLQMKKISLDDLNKLWADSD